MEMSGEQRIAAPREKVWGALNDPEILRRAIPGCQTLERSGENAFTAKVKAKVGPVAATLSGAVTLKDIEPPHRYTISGEGKGGAAGFAKGSADVSLEPDGDATILRYRVQASVGGKLAQVGGRLIQGTANKMAGAFFTAFAAQVEGGEAGESESPEAPAAPPGEPAPPDDDMRPSTHPDTQPGGLGQRTWMLGLLVALALLALFFVFG